MRIISCASYYGTGSSAITDLLSEYNIGKSLSNYEFRFVQDPEGISDLEYNLVENHHRHNSGHALKRYKKKVDFLAGNKFIKKYEHFFNGNWTDISYEYIRQLTAFTYQGYWHQDVIDRGNGFYIRKRLINKVLQHSIWRREIERSLNELPKEITYCSMPTEELFLNLTKKYIDTLFLAANLENKQDVIVDQIVPPSNLKRYLRYFNDIRVFVVDRDPRDIYLLEKYIWKGNVIPTKDVKIFCEWYQYTRNHRKYEQYPTDKVMFIQFEDLIYRYEDSVAKIEKWLGYTKEEHIEAKKYFDPSKSICNTRIWDKIEGIDEEIDFIKKELQEYLYMP